MYELVLDRSTIVMWRAMFLIVVLIFSTSLIGLWFIIVKKKSKLLAFLAGLVCIISIVAFSRTTLSPYSYYRKRIEPSIVIGEEVLKRYSDYEKEYSQYPSSVSEVYFSELDYFDEIVGVRENLTKCDGFGVRCRGLMVTSDGKLVVHVHDELIQCDITNLARRWKCWDHR